MQKKHYDPYLYITNILPQLNARVPRTSGKAQVSRVDAVHTQRSQACSHLITSPPYLNAQDYFRNFKLELYVLEDLMNFTVDGIKETFLGTERGNLSRRISTAAKEYNRDLIPCLYKIERGDKRLALVVHKYFNHMRTSLSKVTRGLEQDGKLIMICGENVVNGHLVKTWEAIDGILSDTGFILSERYSDKITRRMLAPKRHGHRALMQRELVSCYTFA